MFLFYVIGFSLSFYVYAVTIGRQVSYSVILEAGFFRGFTRWACPRRLRMRDKNFNALRPNAIGIGKCKRRMFHSAMRCFFRGRDMGETKEVMLGNDIISPSDTPK